MEIINKIKSLIEKHKKHFSNNLLLEKNGEVIDNVNIKYDIYSSKRWPGRIIANNLGVTNYDVFFLLYKLESSHTRFIEIIVKKTLFGKIVFKAI